MTDPLTLLVITILSLAVGAIASRIYTSLTMNDMRETLAEASRVMLNLQAENERLEKELEQWRKGLDYLAKVNFGEGLPPSDDASDDLGVPEGAWPTGRPAVVKQTPRAEGT